MNNTTGKILKYALWAIMAISLIFVVIFFNKNGEIDSNLSFADQAKMFGSSLEWILKWTYLLFALSTVAAIAFPLMFMVKNPQKAKMFLLSLVVFGIVIALSYSLASNELIRFFGWEKFQADMTPSIMKWVGTGLYSTYVFSILAIGSILYTEIAKSFK